MIARSAARALTFEFIFMSIYLHLPPFFCFFVLLRSRDSMPVDGSFRGGGGEGRGTSWTPSAVFVSTSPDLQLWKSTLIPGRSSAAGRQASRSNIFKFDAVQLVVAFKPINNSESIQICPVLYKSMVWKIPINLNRNSKLVKN